MKFNFSVLTKVFQKKEVVYIPNLMAQRPTRDFYQIEVTAINKALKRIKKELEQQGFKVIHRGSNTRESYFDN